MNPGIVIIKYLKDTESQAALNYLFVRVTLTGRAAATSHRKLDPARLSSSIRNDKVIGHCRERGGSYQRSALVRLREYEEAAILL